MTNPSPEIIALGEARASFDEAFFVAKALFENFDVEVVTFDFRGRTIRVEDDMTVGEAFEQ